MYRLFHILHRHRYTHCQHYYYYHLITMSPSIMYAWIPSQLGLHLKTTIIISSCNQLRGLITHMYTVILNKCNYYYITNCIIKICQCCNCSPVINRLMQGYIESDDYLDVNQGPWPAIRKENRSNRNVFFEMNAQSIMDRKEKQWNNFKTTKKEGHVQNQE